MNPAINIELKFFLVSILWGILLLIAYDVLRIFRRIIKHDNFFVALEDLIFWVVASLFIFAMIYEENNGIIRGFSIMGMILGGVFYHYAFSDLLTNLITKLIRILLRPITIILRRIKSFLLFLLRRLKKTGNKLLLRLKKEMKSVRIAVEIKRKKKLLKKEAAKKEAARKAAAKRKAAEEAEAKKASAKKVRAKKARAGKASGKKVAAEKSIASREAGKAAETEKQTAARVVPRMVEPKPLPIRKNARKT